MHVRIPISEAFSPYPSIFEQRIVRNNGLDVHSIRYFSSDGPETERAGLAEAQNKR